MLASISFPPTRTPHLSDPDAKVSAPSQLPCRQRLPSRTQPTPIHTSVDTSRCAQCAAPHLGRSDSVSSRLVAPQAPDRAAQCENKASPNEDARWRGLG